MKNQTKEMIAEAFKQLLRKKDFREITVTEICEAVGCQRRTFYYHFDDEYQLAAWIYTQTMNTVWDPNYGPYDFRENYIAGLIAIQKDTDLYRKVLPDDALSGLYKHIVQYGDTMFEERIRKNHPEVLVDENLRFMIHYSNQAQICVIREWLFSPHPEEASSLVAKIIESFPERLRGLLL